MLPKSRTTALTVLKSGHWFRGLPDSLLQEIADLSVIRNYEAGQVIFERDEPGNYIYGIIAGSVRISTQSEEGRDLALNTMGAGDIGGEIAVLDGGVRTATGTAWSSTTVFVIHRDQLRELMLKRPEIALHMIEVLCERVRQTSQQVENAAFLSLPQRLARQLRVMVEDAAHGAQAGMSSPCRLDISQSELASFLNASRQGVNICLQGWQKEGYVSIGRGYVVVEDLEGIFTSAGVVGPGG